MDAKENGVSSLCFCRPTHRRCRCQFVVVTVTVTVVVVVVVVVVVFVALLLLLLLVVAVVVVVVVVPAKHAFSLFVFVELVVLGWLVRLTECVRTQLVWRCIAVRPLFLGSFFVVLHWMDPSNCG